MPADITGTDVLEEDRATGRRVFRFVRGPIFANIVLADEINRTPPKTQAALLQAMQEYRVTAGGQTYALPLPFLVFATQNPIEQEGTYPLPEAQLDRFMFQIDVGYPSADEEVAHRQADDDRLPADAAQGAVARAHPRAAGRWCCACRRRHTWSQHAVALCRASRPGRGDRARASCKKYVAWGAGPRASQYLILGAKARAILDGRFAVVDRGRARAGARRCCSTA